MESISRIPAPATVTGRQLSIMTVGKVHASCSQGRFSPAIARTFKAKTAAMPSSVLTPSSGQRVNVRPEEIKFLPPLLGLHQLRAHQDSPAGFQKRNAIPRTAIM